MVIYFFIHPIKSSIHRLRCILHVSHNAKYHRRTDLTDSLGATKQELTMTFFQHTANWIRGEIFEAQMLVLWGVALITMGVFFWKFGFVSTTRSMIAPFLVAGFFWIAGGTYSLINNTHRMPVFQAQYDADSKKFVAQEQQRVADFSKWYRYLLITWSLLIFIGLAVFMLIGGDTWRAAGVGLILFGVSGLMVDHTSEQNALTYAARISAEISQAKP